MGGTREEREARGKSGHGDDKDNVGKQERQRAFKRALPPGRKGGKKRDGSAGDSKEGVKEEKQCSHPKIQSETLLGGRRKGEREKRLLYWCSRPPCSPPESNHERQHRDPHAVARAAAEASAPLCVCVCVCVQALESAHRHT